MSKIVRYSSILLANAIAATGLAQASDSDTACAPEQRDPARAIALFDEAAALYRTALETASADRLESSCRSFEESQRLDPLVETLINLAECRRAQSRFATAYGQYRRAAELARDQGRTKLEKEATSRGDEIAADRSHLTIHVQTPVPALTILRDGERVGDAQFGRRLPIDPGTHVIAASAPGYQSVEMRVAVSERKDEQSVTVPALQPLPVQPPAQPALAPQSPASGTGGPRAIEQYAPLAPPDPWPWILGGAGAAALVVGGVSGALALHDNGTIADHCHDQSPCADPQALSLQTRRNFEWNLARVAAPLGLVALGTAVTWRLLDKKREPARASASPSTLGASIDHHAGQLWLRGEF